MNFKRNSHREDVLFILALVIPAVMSTTRYFETERQMTQIARAQSGNTEVALQARPAPSSNVVRSIVALNTRAQPSGVSRDLTPLAAYGSL
jgi:hypothetical protein